MSENNLPDPILIREITPCNLLSFGPDAHPIQLGALNVVIGPNGSGKSNLIEAVALLRSTAKDIRDTIRKGDGVTEWIWKGNADRPASVTAIIADPKGNQPLRHIFAFRSEQQLFRLEDERIENEKPYSGETGSHFYYHYQHGRPVLNIPGGEKRLINEDLAPDESILTKLRDPVTYPEIFYLANVYEKIRFYREWQFGRNTLDTLFRNPQRTDSRNDILEEDFSNLGMFLSRLRLEPKTKKLILKNLRDLYEGLDDFQIFPQGGTLQIFFNEGDFSIPATRLSDGALRYLSLLAILCDPTPPPLICIEEPELGLHPDILPKLADLLLDASQRTQLIVTTHSDSIVNALTKFPESVLICEKHAGQTQIERLDPDHLKEWLKNYGLGELWTRGELGGNRW
jgi:predicted ATPase